MLVTILPLPMSVEQDARNRAGRTFWQGLAVDVAVALLIAVGPILLGSGFAFSRDYWTAVGLLAAKSVIQAVVSYFARKLIPPPNAGRHR